MIAAGGGGGDGRGSVGGNGGGTTGGSGGLSPTEADPGDSPTASGGGGGTIAAGGAGGSPGVFVPPPKCGVDGTKGSPGQGPASGLSSFGVGGAGAHQFAEQTPCQIAGAGSGGGGGGGYYGGGGGGSGYYFGGGGGGGSGYLEPGATKAASGVSPYAAGNGLVTLTVARGGPEVDRVDPSTGRDTGDQTISVFGSGLTDADQVAFEFHCARVITVGAARFTHGTDTQLSAVTPNLQFVYQHSQSDFRGCDPSKLVADLRVHVPSGKSGAPSAWSPVNPPGDRYTFAVTGITSVSPDRGPIAGLHKLTVAGWGLADVDAVRFELNCRSKTVDVASDSFSAQGDSRLRVITPNLLFLYEHCRSDFQTCSLPDLASGLQARTRETTSPGELWTTADRAYDGYTFLAPRVDSVGPDSGPIKGGTSLTVTGLGLTGADRARFAFSCGPRLVNLAAASIRLQSDTQLALTSPNALFAYQQDKADFAGCDLAKLAADVEVHVSSGPGDHFPGLWSSANCAHDGYTFKGAHDLIVKQHRCG